MKIYVFLEVSFVFAIQYLCSFPRAKVYLKKNKTTLESDLFYDIDNICILFGGVQ